MSYFFYKKHDQVACSSKENLTSKQFIKKIRYFCRGTTRGRPTSAGPGNAKQTQTVDADAFEKDIGDGPQSRQRKT